MCKICCTFAADCKNKQHQTISNNFKQHTIMNKFFYFIAATLVAVSFASCEQNKPSQPKDDDDDSPKTKNSLTFKMDINIVSSNEVSWTVTPSDTSVWYFSGCATLASFEGVGAPSIEESPEPLLAQLTGAGFNFNALRYLFAPPAVHKGEWSYSRTDYLPNMEYILFAFPVDTNLNVLGDIAYQIFTMPREYVDLGLTSGTLWASVSEPGLWTYDRAIQDFGGAVPTQEQWNELMNECIWVNGYSVAEGYWGKTQVNGYSIQGPNGKWIFIACQGGVDCEGVKIDSETDTFYWTSTSDDANTAYAALGLQQSSGYVVTSTSLLSTCNSIGVHLVNQK